VVREVDFCHHTQLHGLHAMSLGHTIGRLGTVNVANDTSIPLLLHNPLQVPALVGAMWDTMSYIAFAVQRRASQGWSPHQRLARRR
jgi:hypothetical protein